MSDPYFDDADLYLKATQEFESGNAHSAIWAKALALNAGDHDKAKYEYIRVRVVALKEAAKAAYKNSSDSTTPAAKTSDLPRNHSEAGRALVIGRDDIIIESIRAGELRGRIVNGTWYLSDDEPDNPSTAINSRPGEAETTTDRSDNISPALGGTFHALVNGDLGLARTYWLYGVFIGALFGVAASVFAENDNWVASGIVVMLSIAYSTVVLLGIWRSANKYDGPYLWSILAKVATVLGGLQITIAVFAILASLVA